VHGDLDDTRIAAPRPEVPVADVDHDDTVVRGSVPVPVEPPPALVEPPPPAARPLPIVDPVVGAIEPVTVDPVAPVAAPPSFVARLANGTELPIDGPVYFGRKPSAPRIHTGSPPRLVTFPSPSRELSATHLELRLVGDSLIASDMRSTNGTVVRLPRSAPRTLIRGESIVVVPGTRIDLGDGAVIDILDPAGAVTS
jgi:hypothetical protein